MKAIQFLEQIKKLDALIANKWIEIHQLQELCESTTANLTGERVQSSHNPNRMAEAVAKYIDLEAQIVHQDIKRLIEARKKVLAVIEQLDALEYDVLHKVYVQHLSVGDVADIYRQSYGAVSQNLDRARKSVQKVLDDGKSINAT